MDDCTGYMHPQYAYSLQEFGRPRELTRSGGWVLERPIPGTAYKDAMGCYPVFACRDWTRLPEDLEQLGGDLVSLALVVDPFSGVTPAYLERCFDIVKPFKTHYVADLVQKPETFVGKVHRRCARKSLEKMDVEICFQPARYIDEWIRLYDNLIKRHAIKGINAFSRKCFEMQLNMSGMMIFLGRQGGEIVGASLVLTAGQAAYFHLSASSADGYKIRAAYGIHWKVLEYGRENGIRYFDVGGIAGMKDDPGESLAKFKRGWANDQQVAYFCGRIFNPQIYQSICKQHRTVNTGYFPAYRGGDPVVQKAGGLRRPILSNPKRCRL